MEAFLKSIIIIGLIILLWSSFFLPELQKLENLRQEIADLKASSQRFDQGRGLLYLQTIQFQKDAIASKTREYSFLLPPFSQTRANLMAPFNEIRNSIPGNWEVTPDGKFNKVGNLVTWLFSFSFTGSLFDAIRALATMETTEQLMRFRNITIERQQNGVLLTGKVELVFRDFDSATSTKEIKQ
ncbi:MAG: hypothetical protein HQM08_18355 [Candidatus Riflebacteria bacterium]|nr:hypothetical protein [Candidatus Riflebacteria bacterium]